MSIRVKNKTNKIIVIGKLDILPDAVADLDEKDSSNAVVRRFIEMGFLVQIPNTFADEVEATPEDRAATIDKMKKAELIAECEKLSIETKGLTVAQLKQALLEACI